MQDTTREIRRLAPDDDEIPEDSLMIMERVVAELYDEVESDERAFSDRLHIYLLERFVRSRGSRKISAKEELFGYDDTAPEKERCIVCAKEFLPRFYTLIVEESKGIWIKKPSSDDPSKSVRIGNYLLFERTVGLDVETIIVAACDSCIGRLRCKDFRNGMLVDRRKRNKRHTMTYAVAKARKEERDAFIRATRERFARMEQAATARIQRSFTRS
ncbi:MAG: hypothetical protein AAB407_01145 [Patescibacteria group bacterium]